jgi:hypothetical protein
MLNNGVSRLNCKSGSTSGLKTPFVLALCAMLLLQPATGIAQESVAQKQQGSASPTSEFSSSQPAASVDELPSAPVPQASSQPQNDPGQQPSAPQQQTQPAPQQTQPVQQPNSTQSPNEPQRPIGTAAAPYEKPTGVPGSRPAGAAIAPAKQRRVRAIVISLGLILAGAGAIGAVAGMSKASHSQP